MSRASAYAACCPRNDQANKLARAIADADDSKALRQVLKQKELEIETTEQHLARVRSQVQPHLRRHKTREVKVGAAPLFTGNDVEDRALLHSLIDAAPTGLMRP